MRRGLALRPPPFKYEQPVNIIGNKQIFKKNDQFHMIVCIVSNKNLLLSTYRLLCNLTVTSLSDSTDMLLDVHIVCVVIISFCQDWFGSGLQHDRLGFQGVHTVLDFVLTEFESMDGGESVYKHACLCVYLQPCGCLVTNICLSTSMCLFTNRCLQLFLFIVPAGWVKLSVHLVLLSSAQSPPV